MKTWEVCSESTSFSYLIHLNHKYAVAMGGVTDEVEAVVDTEDLIEAFDGDEDDAEQQKQLFLRHWALEGEKIFPPNGWPAASGETEDVSAHCVCAGGI